MLIRVRSGEIKDVCFFAPFTSRFVAQGELPYNTLYEDIKEFIGLGEVFLVGDFNARTASCQASFLTHQ